MCFGTIGDLVAHAGAELESPAVAKLGVELTGETEQDVSLLAPVIGAVPGRVLHHANADGPNCLVRHSAVPTSPACSVGGIVAQSVVPNGIWVICITIA